MHDDVFADDPTRLIDAADAVGLALAEVADADTGRCPYPPAMLEMPGHPVYLDEFTAEELQAATEFLCRLGFLVHRPATDES